MSKPLVIDIYHGDPVTSFAKVKAFGIVACIHKASQGANTIDKLYEVRRIAALEAGLLWGAYHFMDLTDPVAQADNFLSVAEPDATTAFVLDWESIDKSSPTVASVREWLTIVDEAIGRKCVLYSGNVAKERLDGIKDEFFGSHRLWLAQYGPRWKVQESWSAPWLWQNNGDRSGPGPHRIPGISGLCDNSTIIDPMTVEELKAGWSI